ncbi:MAG: efflux RND transporter periplasmic adaptor subunit [Gammaproteobacteria bacterium]|nr:efflux RND transporter periplasmic adaptor subunit [Gammaproteobacteria bacterium]
MTVSKRAGEQVRRIAGVVEAGLVSDLAFEASGKIMALSLELGDEVQAGLVVAELDPEPFELAMKSARGSLNEASARFRDTQAKFKQQEQLIDKGYTSRTDYDSALANLSSARSNVEVARSQLDIAERNLKQTKLIAPFAGRVSQKYTERFTEVTAGQKIVQVSSLGEQKVEVSVPEGMVSKLSIGDPVTIRFPTLPDLTDTGKIASIATRASVANSFPVTVSLDSQSPDVKAGISAEVSFQFATAVTGKAFMLPVTAVLPSGQKGQAIVFVFDESQSVVREKRVHVVNVRDNELEVTGDIQVGDVVASAGVSFLSDAMEVKLLSAPRK